MKKPELLAPAGDMECVETAMRFGADAVYMGGPAMQLRADKVGFTAESLHSAIEYVHSKGRRAYVTVNCFAFDDDIAALSDYAKLLVSVGADAAIISDLGALVTVRNAAPELEVHISTQANCMNHATARTYHDLGASRVVLARELPLTSIARMRELCPPELEFEAFVHGAMCMAFSGRCLISSYLTARSGNRGECSQPCRWRYHLVEEQRPGQYFPIEEYEKGSAILSSHDLCCIDIIDDIAAAGVSSFKIEGRMKTAYYVANTVDAYRRRIDGTASLEYCRDELECVNHHPYSTGFYLGDEIEGTYNSGLRTQRCLFAGKVLASDSGHITLEQRTRFALGDTLEILSPDFPAAPFTVEKIVDENGNEQASAPHPRQIVRIPCPYPAKAGDIIRCRVKEK